MATKTELHKIAYTSINRAWRGRETLTQPLVPLPTRKGKPLVEDKTEYTSGIVPHPSISTKVVYIPDDLFLFFEKLWRVDPYVRCAIDKLTDYTLQNDFHIYFPENKDLARDVGHWMRAHGFYILAENLSRNLYMFGNCFMWKDLERLKTGAIGRPRSDAPYIISDHRIVHPAYMFVRRKLTGEVIGYVQKKTRLELGWTSFTTKEMMHILYRPVADRTYGFGIIEPVLRDLHYERITENDLVEIIHDYVAPIYHIKCGIVNPRTGAIKPADQASIDKLRDYLATLAPTDDIITDIAVEISPIGAGRQIGETEPTLKHLKANLIAGLGMPEFFYGSSQGVTQNVAIVQHEMIVKTIRAQQKLIAYSMETQLIPYILLEIIKDRLWEDIYKKSPDKIQDLTRADLDSFLSAYEIAKIPRMIFNPIESDKDRHQRLRETYNAGGITLNEWRAESYREPLNISIKLLGKAYNLADLPLPIVNALLQLHTAKEQELSKEQQKNKLTGKGERTPASTKTGTKSVDGTGNPVATDLKTQPKKV